MIFGLTPPNYETEILYWSNFLQLIFLPVITVGTAIMNRDSEQRAMEDHLTIQREFDMLQETHQWIDKSLEEISKGVHALLVRSGGEQAALLSAMGGEDTSLKKKSSGR